MSLAALTIPVSGNRQFNQFFTKPELGDLLVSQITLRSAGNVVELGAGGGALLAAARRRFSDAKLTSIDIDVTFKQLGGGAPNHQHVVSNVLDPRFIRNKRFVGDTFDLAVCNPPYQQTSWTELYRNLLTSVGLGSIIPFQGDVSADVIFLAHNLRLLRHGGQMGIIVPDGIVTGERHRRLREALLSNHAIHSAIELPERAFPGTDARTYILTIQKGGVTPSVFPIYRADDARGLSAPILLRSDEAAVRMDYRYYSWQRKNCEVETTVLNDVAGLEIIRGKWSATAAKKAGLPILHSTDIPATLTPTLLGLSRAHVRRAFGDAPRAVAGDLVITRVGRNLECKVALVTTGQAVVSDCLYIVRGPKKIIKIVWRSLNSDAGRAWLSAHSRGVCAKVINRSALVNYPVMI